MSKASVPDVISTFVHGVAKGISGLTSLGFFLAFTIFSLFMLLKDGPKLRRWIDRHLGVPPTVAQTITGNVVLSIRRYFLGTTIVATFNAIVVGVGALDPRRAARGDDRRRHPRHRLYPVRRRVRVRRVRGRRSHSARQGHETR